MSKTIDQRVVEMRFDNKHFENNVKESMSTLDKLKQKLNLKGASKGLENLNTSANKVNMSGLSNALTSVHSKFSALEIMGVTALANITNSAVNAGKRIASALTIDPIKTGLSEYETQINAVQTILANTQKEGTNVEIVNKALDELNAYADKTIYNFTEMTRNIGTFTAAGVKLDDSVNAIKGIANLAAVSGSTSQQASTAMYQLSQALAAGKVQLMDWNSVVNAGMGGQVFQDALIRTSELLGTGAKKAIKTYGSFRESLTKGEWLTTEVLNETLKQLAGAYSKADLMAQGFSEKQADEIVKLANTAEDAATKVKTFTQLWDVLKESAQSGWSQTWRIIIGDFEEAKALFSPLAKFLTGIIDGFSTARNKLLESALGKSFTGLLDKVKTSADGVKKVVDSVKDYAKVVDEIIGGKWGNGQKRWDALTKAGYDWAHAQNLVNERLGFSLRRTTQYKESQDEAAKSQDKVNEVTADYIVELTKLSDAQLKEKGYTDEQIKAFRELEKAAKKTGIPLREFIENIDKIDGRYLLINSFKNLGMSLVSVFKSIGEAWRNAFPPMSSDTLFDIIAGFHKFSTIIRIKVEKNADKLTRTLKGLFAILDLISMVVGGGLKIAFTILKTILSAFNMNILDFTALIGDGIVKVRDWIENNNILVKGIKKLAEYVKMAVEAIKEWVTNNEIIAKGIERIKSSLKGMSDGLKNWFEGLKETDNIPKYILQGLVNGLKNGVGFVFDAFIELGKGILQAIKDVLGIHSPSTEFFEIGKNIIQGLVNGLKSGVKGLWNFIKEIATTCVDLFNKIDFGKVLAAGIGISMLLLVKKLIDIIQNFVSPLEGFANMLEGIGSAFENIGKGIKTKLVSEAMKNMAVSIAILAVSILLLSRLDPGTLWATIGAIAALAAIIGALAILASKLNKIESFKDVGKALLPIISIAGSLLLLALTLKAISTIDPDRMVSTIFGFIGMIAGLSLLCITIGKFVKDRDVENIDKVGKMIKKIAWALLIMVAVIKLASMLDETDVLKGMAVVTLFGVFVSALMIVSKYAGTTANKTGKMISKLAFSLLIMIGVIKLASMLEVGEILKGITLIGLLGVFFAALIKVSEHSGRHAAKAGAMMLMVSIALLATIAAVKLIANMSGYDVLKSLPVILGLGIFFKTLIKVSEHAGQNAVKAGLMLVLVAGALAIMTGVLFILSKMNQKELYPALGIITILELLFGGLIYVTKFATDCMKSLITITVAITLLIAAVIGLSFIDPAKLAASTAAISSLMVALALVIGSTKFIGNPGTLMKPLLSLVGVIAILAGILVTMSLLDVEASISSATALSILLGTMTGVLAIISKMGPASMTGIGALALLGLVIGELGAMLALMKYFDVTPSIETAKALSTLLLAMSASLVVLGYVGTLGPAAFIGIAALATLIAAIGGIVVAIGALANKFPMIEEFLDKGIPVLEKIGYALGSFVGNIVGGLLAGVTAGLPAIGTNLSMFMQNAQVFINGAKNIDESVVNGISALSKAIIFLTAADFIAGITSFMTGGTSFGQLGTELSNFMNNASDFISKSANINPAIMEGVKTLAEAVNILTTTNFVQSITSWLTGGNSFAEFGNQLGGLGTSINQFVTNLGSFDETKLNTITCACNAIKTLAQAASEIPNDGGLAGFFAGENNIGVFAQKLPMLGTHMNQFVTNLGTFSDGQVTTVKCAGKAISELAKAASEIPNDGGVAGFFTGNNDLSVFGQKLPMLGSQLSQFIINLGMFSDAQVSTVDCAGKAILSLSKAASQIPNEGGVAGFFAGNNDLGVFGEKLPGLAKNIAGFVKNLGTFSEAQVATVGSACKAISTIAKLGEINIQDTGDGLNSFGKNMVKFAKRVKEFIGHISEVGIGNIESAISKTEELVEMAKTIASTNVSALKTFGESLKKVAKDGVKGFVKEFSGASPKAEAKKATKAMLDAAISGAESKKSDVKNKFKSIAETAVDAMCTKALKESAKQAGKDLVTGFANGIKNNKSLATSAGSSIGKAALKAAKEAIDSNSPSKEAMKIGNFFGQGLVIGIDDYASKTYDSAYNIGDRAKTGLSRAIARISDVINSDMDTQPTIRPVLDLSDVESGAGYLSTMFNNGPSIGVTSNLRAISSGMNSRSQNGANGDVVSALNKLRKDLGNISGDTYNINGVTYDDGSNITDAVKTIVRAATMERRT